MIPTNGTVQLRAGQLSACILLYGATLQNLRLKGHSAPLVLGYDDVEQYKRCDHYLGSTVGRFSNRISGATFDLNGRTHTLDANERGNCLHGGEFGFHRQDWSVLEVRKSAVTLGHISPDGAMGFPGRLDARCTYRLTPDDTMEVTFELASDAPTIAALAHHSYFNLDDGGRSTIDRHSVEIHADQIMATGIDSAPNGELITVADTPFDFRLPQQIGARRIDHNFCVSSKRVELRPVAKLSGSNGVAMTVHSTEPGLQLYTADGLPNGGMQGLGGIEYAPRSGICFEAQVWPDAPNHAHFPCAVVLPERPVVQRTIYAFHRH